MKTARCAAAALLASICSGQLICASAWATDSVTLYGSLDAGLGYIDNAGGHSLKRLESGSLYANRLGFRGQEDLGGGLAAVFVLEGGLNVDDGTITLGGRSFGRQSYVGLSSSRWGSITLGRQYDFLYAGSPLPLDVGALLIGGLAGASGGAGTGVDNHSGGVRYDNSIKWQGRFGDWTLGAMHGFGSENRSDKIDSAAISYRAGGLWLGGAWLKDNFSAATSGNKIALLGLNWDVSPAHKLVLTASSAKADVASDRRSKNDMLQAGWLWRPTDLWLLGLMAGQADIRNAAGAEGKLRQYGLGSQYLLSKRTQLYGIWSQVRSSGSAGTAYSGVPGIGAPAASLRSSDNSQAVFRVGVLHKF